MPTKYSSRILLTLTLGLLATITANAGWGKFASAPTSFQTTDFGLLQPKTAGAAPTLGNYPTVAMALSGNLTITPDAPPTNSASISVQAPASFTGQLTADPVTGIVRVTNAQPGRFTSLGIAITVRAFGSNGASVSKTFGLLVLPDTYCNQQSYFISPTVPEIPVGSLPYAVAIGDFNNDGNQDVVTPNYFANNVSIRLGNGSGGFTSPAVPEVAMAGNPAGVAIGDFNGDGNQDIAVSKYYSSPSSVSIRLGDGSGGFTSPETPEIEVGPHPHGIALGDFNRDGRADLAVTNDHDSITIRLGDGSGGFTQSPAGDPQGIFGESVVIADFNRDGWQDIAAANGLFSVSIRWGDGMGGFTSPPVPDVIVDGSPRNLVVGDFNDDRIPDFAATIWNKNKVSIRLGDGWGGFISPATPEVVVGPAPYSIAVGDFNNDGRQDFAVTHNLQEMGNNVSVRYGDGLGGFTSTATSAVILGGHPNAIAIGDFNGDGIQDFATSDYPSSVSIRLGACGAGSPTNTPTRTATRTPTPTSTPSNTGTPIVTPTALNTVAVSLSSMTASEESTITVPITVGDMTGLGVISYDLQISFDPAVVQPASPPIDATGTLSDGMFFNTNVSNQGHMIISAYRNPVLSGSGTLLYLRFNVVGTAGQSTSLLFEDYIDPFTQQLHWAVLLNEGEPGAMVTNGRVTVGDFGSISGTVEYGNANSYPSLPRYVSNVLISAAGSLPVSTFTDVTGTYSLGGFGAGSYIVVPSKIGGINGSITSYDAAKISQHVTGITPLNPTQLFVADVSDNEGISSLDAAMLARYVAGTPYTVSQIGSTSTWKFLPTARTYQFMVGTINGENYPALLMGEISGNWSDSVSSRPTDNRNGPERSASVAAPHLKSQADKEILVPIKVQGAAKKGIIAYEFDLRYDASVIRPQNEPVELANTASRGFSVVANPYEPGLLKIVVYGPIPIHENGLLLNLKFISVGASGTVSPLIWERFMFNEGEVGVRLVNGEVRLG